MNVVLSCAQLGFAFGDTPVLRGISLTLERGGYLSILGPNGSGKSTLLKCFLRLHDTGRMSGQISVHGRAQGAYSQRELARRIAYVPQAGGRIPPFTVAEFLRLSRYPYAARTAPRAEDGGAVTRALELTGTAHLAGRRLDALSGGERQKACLAAALAQGTDILLLDEPTSFLDPHHAAELNALLKRLNRQEHLTMLTVTHDLGHPFEMGGHALVLRHGRQLYLGPASALAGNGVLEQAFAHPFSYLSHPRTGQTLVLADPIEVTP